MYLSTSMHEVNNPSNTQLNGDYSGGNAVYFVIQPPVDEVWGIKVITGIIECGVQLKPEDFGVIADGLTNGLVFEVSDDDTAYLTIGGSEAITTNRNLYYMTSAMETSETLFDSNDWVYKFTINFMTKGEPIVLDGSKNQRIQVYLSEDLSSLDEFLIFGNGFKAVRGGRSLGLLNARYILPFKDEVV